MQRKNAFLWIKMRFWWAEVDSNHRSRRRQIYSLIHLAALESAHIFRCNSIRCGAGDWTRTHNLLITNQLLCQLSYTGVCLVPWGGIEPPTGRFSVCCSTDWATKAYWRPKTGSNRRPPAWQAGALTNWATGPNLKCPETVLVYNNLFRNFCQAFYFGFCIFFLVFLTFFT